MRVLVVGAGAWGTAVAVHTAAQHATTLWTHRPEQAQAMRGARVNAAYLPGVALPPALAMNDSTALAHVAAEHDVVLLATPMAALRAMLQTLANAPVPVVWLCKGLEDSHDALLGHEIAQQVAPTLRGGVLSGPSFAQEVAAGKPCALVAASPHAEVRQVLVQVLHGAALRVYTNDDWIGVELGGAVKNVLALATGLADGMGLGLNARAALITRGLAEMSRLGQALGARADTFMGLSGVGDLVLTTTGDLSRNRRVGLALASGKPLHAILADLGHVAEGVPCAHALQRRAEALGVDMPIATAVKAVLDATMAPEQALHLLLSREPGQERV